MKMAGWRDPVAGFIPSRQCHMGSIVTDAHLQGPAG
jgi:hypothetical protein